MGNDQQEATPFQSGPGSSAGTARAALEATSEEKDGVNRKFVLGVVNASHFLNHLQSGQGSILLPIMMWEMGFDYLQLGLLSSAHQLSANGMQVIYGVLAQYYRRSVLLGIGNVIVGLSSAAMGLSQWFGQVLIIRTVAGAGSSAQHPVGSTTLASFFRSSKGKVLGMHHAAGNIGSLVAPLLVVALLTYLDWRTIWIIVAIPSVLMGFAYFFFRDSITKAGDPKKGGSRIGLRSYLECLKNRDVMTVSAIQMVGAAGRGTGVNNTYMVPFFMVSLGVDARVAALLLALIQFGSVVGPVGIGWISDRVGRWRSIVAVLMLSFISTVGLVMHSQVSVALLLNLAIYGGVVNARGSLTQAMVADAVPDSHADAAFSLYYFIGFISGPIWTGLTGYLIDSRGFTTAFLVISTTYVLGLGMMALIRPKKKPRTSVAT